MIKQVRFIEAGSCKHPEKFVNPKSGAFKNIRFPSSVAVIEHSKHGIILFDTGYSPRFHEATRHFPEKLYALVTPVSIEPETTALAQLKKMGIQNSDISHVVLSHFHADHVAGVGDFTHAQYVFSREELEHFRGLNRFNRVRAGFLNALLPTDLEARRHPFSDSLSKVDQPIRELGPGWYGKDLFGDESLMLVPLPGHTLGQIGLFIRVSTGENYFLVADAAWLKSSFEENTVPTALAQIVFHDKKTYAETLSRIHEVHQRQPQVQIIPCHCAVTLEAHA
jgi:glyoxylase-like metal-dependent hydrolase (beta-lactamase superfamily II)